MNHKFRFNKESMDRIKRFMTGEEPPQTPEPPQEEEQPSQVEVVREGGLCAALLTDIGCVRVSNQDALVKGEMLFGVADGMGGHNGGETASAGARDGLVSLLEGKQPSVDALRTAFKAVNHRLYLQQQEDESLSGMGTTLSVVWLSENYVYIGHVGDSRVYLLRDGEFRQVTDDHSLVAELERLGQLTHEQALHHPMKNVITRAVGTEETIDTDLMVEERRKGDTWLICSDGLTGMVSDKSIEAIISANEVEKAAELLVEAARKGGGRDNISVALVREEEAAE